MFSPFLKDGKFLGLTLRHAGRFYFFGSRHAAREELPALFPQFQFCFLKQVHGKSVLPARLGTVNEADAHFTSQSGLALVVNSADCVPILLSNANTICAIHSGWRGCAHNIVQASVEKLGTANFAAIGPHIQKSSFEIQEDALILLQQAVPTGHGPFSEPKGGGKFLFDLHQLVRAQLTTAYGQALHLSERTEDTMIHADYHSFRRDRENAGRQFSFVAIEK